MSCELQMEDELPQPSHQQENEQKTGGTWNIHLSFGFIYSLNRAPELLQSQTQNISNTNQPSSK